MRISQKNNDVIYCFVLVSNWQKKLFLKSDEKIYAVLYVYCIWIKLKEKSGKRQYSCPLCSLDKMPLSFTIKYNVGVSLKEILS